MTGKWMFPPGVSTTREKRILKSMVVDGVVPRDRRRTTLHNMVKIRGITMWEMVLVARLPLGKLSPPLKVLVGGAPSKSELY